MRKVTKVWTTKDGEKVRICDMTDQHLLNTIRYLRRSHEEVVLSTPYLSFSGEMAQHYAEQEYDRMLLSEAEDTYPILDSMIDEMRRRGLVEH